MSSPRINSYLLGLNLALLITIALLFGRDVVSGRRLATTPAVPHVVSYQGILTDSSGNPITGTRNLTIKVYAVAAGGAVLWQESHPSVAFNNGAFAVMLGKNTPLPDELFNDPERWLELMVDGTLLSPRQQFTSVPYALNAEKVGGLTAGELASLPAGVIVWTASGQAPAGFTRHPTMLGEDVGTWERLPDIPTDVDNVTCDVWTGSELICWNDRHQTTPTGAIYNKASNSWRSMSTSEAPSARSYRSAVWTGENFIVWGGTTGFGFEETFLNDGGRYDPVTDSWSAISVINAPAARQSHGVVWTDNRMMVFGGRIGSPTASVVTNTGGLYDPLADSWIATSLENAPLLVAPAMFWTGSTVIVWGWDSVDNKVYGAVYDPVTDEWSPITDHHAPKGSYFSRSSADWTGSEMVVWSGGSWYFYDPVADEWRESLASNTGSVSEPVRVAGNLVFARLRIYDISQREQVALVREPLLISTIHWTGEHIIAFLGAGRPRGYAHSITLIEPYVKE
jgi:hypothetical protein